MVDVIYQVSQTGAPATGLVVELHSTTSGDVYPYAELGQGNYKNDDIPVGSYAVYVDGEDKNQQWQVGSGIDASDRNVLNSLDVIPPDATHSQGLLKSDLPIQTTLNSLALGDKIFLEASGNQMSVHYETDHTNHFFANSTVPAHNSISPPIASRAMQFGEAFFDESLAGSVSDEIVPASETITRETPLALISFEFIPAEGLLGDYQLTIASDNEEDYVTIKKFRNDPDPAKGEVDAVEAGAVTSWSNDSVLTYPANAVTTTTVRNLATGAIIGLYASSIDPARAWRRIKFRHTYERYTVSTWIELEDGVVCNGDRVLQTQYTEYTPTDSCFAFETLGDKGVEGLVGGVTIPDGYCVCRYYGGTWHVTKITKSLKKSWDLTQFDPVNQLTLMVSEDGEWAVTNISNQTRATIANNPTVTTATEAWDGRLTLTYEAI